MDFLLLYIPWLKNGVKRTQKLRELRFSAATTFQIIKAEGRAGIFSILIFYV